VNRPPAAVLPLLDALVKNRRYTRFVMLLKIPSKDTATVVAALAKHVRKLPQQLRRSLTWDRGKEMADHKSFTVATKVQRRSSRCSGRQSRSPAG
jgi:IS30 family transposase